jgi:hypothetical protein
MKGSPDEIQTPARWNLIGDSMTASVCYCPAVFFRYLRLLPRPFMQVKELDELLKKSSFQFYSPFLRMRRSEIA